jgi:glycosyltransferase involved in cell wall biosynthesis
MFCPPDRPAPLSIVVLTYNEEQNLPACLESMAGWAGEIFVVDSGSTDHTIEIAERYGARVVMHSFESHAKQWNWALRSLPFTYEWALCLDADHRVTPKLREEICELFQVRSEDVRRQARLDVVDGFYIKRRQIFRGRWIRHGGYYPKHLLKLVRHEWAWSDEHELLDFRFYVKGEMATLQHDLVEDNQKEFDISFWIAKHNQFAQLQAREELLRQRDGIGWNIRPSLFGTPDQRILWLKRIWYHLPLYVRPYLYFFYRYVLRLGFLDGKQGFLFHFLQGFWYRLLVDVVLDDLRRGPASVVGHGQISCHMDRESQPLKNRNSQR